jgi:hypothetical protein
MAATSDNYSIVTEGVSYTIASDYVKPSGAGETAHHQIVKVAYGANDTVNYVSNDAPLPVGLCGSWTRYDYLGGGGYYSLATSLVGIGVTLAIAGIANAEAVGITVGTLTVSATDLDIRNLYGGDSSGSTSGSDYVGVQGIASGYPIGITVSAALPVTVASFSNLGVFGVSGATAVGVTFSTVSIRGLTAASDTITVYGGGTASTVSTGLFGFTGTGVAPIYAEANALNVNIKSSAGITVSAADLDIRNLDYTLDTVTIVGQGATDNQSKATVPTYMNSAVGAAGTLTQVGGVTGAGWCAAALNVYMVNSGITFTVSASATFSSIVGVTAAYSASLPVQGSNQAAYGVWVTGSTSGDPVTVQGNSGGYLPVEVKDFITQTATISTSIGDVKTNTDFLVAMKKALYSDSVSVGAFDFNDKNSIYTLVRDNIGAELTALGNTVVPNNATITTQDSLAVTLVSTKQKSSFVSRTACATGTPQNLTVFNSGAGYTCANGIRIKTSRIATGTNSSQNEIMCVISEADASSYGASAGAYSYVMYHGDEMFFEVDNINRIKVFYPAYSAGFAPHNTGSGVTFSFYAS